ncbi:hypothetical protein CXB51_009930 [Gossypium anomalum]|uniref:Uncharacterized protein n=1 Tax=Gossypium anomalum TaxID=47600 RepID=A0A8J5YLK5_9ROSI|nr:hypothetical protein CXB51_009930 [Gossypium anomalum]
MALGVEVAEFNWDLSLRAQSRRALSMNSVWLREETAGRIKGNKDVNFIEENFSWMAGNKNQGCGQSIDPVLGISLEGSSVFLNSNGEKLITIPVLTEMEHDLEEGVLNW